MTEKKKYYPELNAKINFPEMEKNILNFWEEDKTFEKSVHNRDGAAEFVFYDGPPFANGTPHYGHIMVSGCGRPFSDNERQKGRTPPRVGLPRTAGGNVG